MQIEQWLTGELAIDIWKKKYQHEGESFDAWVNRVSGGNEKMKQLIIEKRCLPAGRILAGRGTNKNGNKLTLSNCFVLPPPEDNIESIFETAKEMARTFSWGGGVGVDISKLRPNNAKVKNSARTTSGATSFMELYSMVTGIIGQRNRRGALMLSIDCTHPDLIEFIKVKSDLNSVTKANISVKINSDFMKAVKENKEWKLHFYVKDNDEHIESIVNAKEVFNMLCKYNWDYAEPGILMWDRIKSWHLLSEDEEFELVGVNPCAEEPLLKYGSCNLISMNLSEYVITNNGYAQFDFVRFNNDVMQVVIFMNEILDEAIKNGMYPLKQQTQAVIDYRQIGIGIMGLADMLIKLGLTYGSKESLELCDKIGKDMINVALKQSALLSKEFGSYPKYKKDKVLKSPFLIHNAYPETIELIEKYGLRNSQLLTIAPTGSLSTMIGISGGIEPLYALSYIRKTETLHNEDTYYNVFTPIVKEYMDKHNISKEEDLPEFFITTQKLDYRSRIDMQSVWQSHIDASISSTVNIPNETTVEQVEDIYMYAYEKDLKGITIFRDGCARLGILTSSKPKEEPINNEDNNEFKLDWGTTLASSDDMIGKKRKIMSGCGSLHVQAWFDPIDGRLYEIYLSKGSQGGCNSFMISLSRAISAGLRTGLDFNYALDQLKSVPSCPSYVTRTATKHDTSIGTSCPSAIANVLLEMQKEIFYELGIEDEVKNKIKNVKKQINHLEETKIDTLKKPKCPECGANLRFEGGCNSCPNCGFSKCE